MIDPQAIAALVYLGFLSPGQVQTETQLQALLLSKDANIAAVLNTQSSALNCYTYYNNVCASSPYIVLDEEELDVYPGSATSNAMLKSYNRNATVVGYIVLDEEELD